MSNTGNFETKTRTVDIPEDPSVSLTKSQAMVRVPQSERENFVNRTLYHGDNLDFLRGLNSETVHLIATDPPFNKNKDFHATPDKLAAGAKFKDRWKWEDDVHDEWVDQIQDDWGASWSVIEAVRKTYGNDMAAVLCWLGVRLMEMHRILRPDGSIYLHIDRTAHAYVKALMDSIFGAKNFRNEIVWCYSGGGIPKKYFPRKHDTILRYSKSDNRTFNVERKEYKENTQQVGIHSTYSGANNQIDIARGTPITDWWNDIPTTTGWSPENTGYPTQKPVALYSRIIKASTNEGDIVLDPFCGCATTPIAAEMLGRQWVGMDIWDEAHDMVLQRLAKEGLAVPKPTSAAPRLITFGDVYYTKEPPERTDNDEVAAPALKLRTRRAKEPWQKLSNEQMKRLLADVQRDPTGMVCCAGCGRRLEIEFMELDHRQPRSDRGENFITNRVLLCRPCNGRKSDRLTMRGLHKENKKIGWLIDAEKANRALDRAHGRAEEVRDNWDQFSTGHAKLSLF